MAISRPREQPLFLKILLNICGPIGLGLALLGIINAVLGLVFLIGGVSYIGWELYPSAVALVRRRPLGSLPIFLCIGAGNWVLRVVACFEDRQSTTHSRPIGIRHQRP
jgi:hypothetical protein